MIIFNGFRCRYIYNEFRWNQMRILLKFTCGEIKCTRPSKIVQQFFCAALHAKKKSKQFFLVSCKMLPSFVLATERARHADTLAQLAIHLECNFSSCLGRLYTSFSLPQVVVFTRRSEPTSPLTPHRLAPAHVSWLYEIDFASSPYESFSRHVMFADKLCSPKLH